MRSCTVRLSTTLSYRALFLPSTTPVRVVAVQYSGSSIAMSQSSRRIYAAMTDNDYLEHLERIDHQLVKLLKERVRVAAEGREAGVREVEEETVDLWTLEAEELGMDTDATEKVARAVITLCRKRTEE
jgi:chorismate mutase